MKTTNQTIVGTSYHDVQITTTPKKLKQVAEKLGAEYFEANDGHDKSNFNFMFETSDGDVFTVYDWKYYETLQDDELIEFNIGSKDKISSLKAKHELSVELGKPSISSQKDVEYLTFELEQKISAYCTKQDLPEGHTVEEILEYVAPLTCSQIKQLKKFDKELKELGVVSH